MGMRPFNTYNYFWIARYDGEYTIREENPAVQLLNLRLKKTVRGTHPTLSFIVSRS